jgi:hypothetical protein
MGFNAVTGQDDLQDSLTQAGYQNPVPAASQPEPDVSGFLNAIQQIESSGGKNFNHPTMESGLQAGDTAMGRYGMMPNTVREVANRARMQGALDPDMKRIAGMDDGSLMKSEMEAHPEVEQRFAETLAKHLLKKFPNEQEAAYSWNQGHNLTPEAVEKRNYKDSDYVQKFNKLRQMLLANKGE